MHIDVHVAYLATATAACIELGATAIGAVVDDEESGPVQVMADPEGNEFCLVI